MFRCSVCKVSSLPRVKPVMVPKEEQLRQYSYFDAEDNPVVVFGKEIISELRLCPGCAGSEPAAPIVDVQASIGLGLAMQGHARKCQKKFDECFVCQRNVTVYATISTPAINGVLSDSRVHTGHISVAALALTSMVERTTHKSKRANADFMTAFATLKGYETRGGTI